MGTWLSFNEVFLNIFFTISNKKVVYFHIMSNGFYSEYIPVINDVSIGTPKEEMLNNLGKTNFSTISEFSQNKCNFYEGIVFCVSEESGTIYDIWIPSILE